MSRLTDKRFTKSGFVAISNEERKKLYIPTLEEVYIKLAEYEDLEEQGRLIKLPCKVGDKVYPLSYGYYQELIVMSIQFTKDAEYDSLEFEMESYDHIHYDCFCLDDIGRTVFFDKDERDKAWAECVCREEEAIKKAKGE